MDEAAEERSLLLPRIERALGHQSFADEDIPALAEIAEVWAEVRFDVVTSRFTGVGVTAVSVSTPGGRTVDMTPYLHAVVRRAGSVTEVRLVVPRLPSGLGFGTVTTATNRGRTSDSKLLPLEADYPSSSTAADLRAAETVLNGTLGSAMLVGHAGPGGRSRSEPWSRGPLSKTERQARWRASRRMVTVELPAEVAQALRSAQATRGGSLAEIVTAALTALNGSGR